MKSFFITLIILLISYSLYSQVELYRSNSNYKYSEVGDGLGNTQFQKTPDTANLIIKLLYDKKINKDIFNTINFSTKNKSDIHIVFWRGSFKINIISEFVDSKANGVMFWFNKRGKIEIIAEYKNDKLIDILYYRKKSFLNKFTSVFGYTPPLTIQVTL